MNKYFIFKTLTFIFVALTFAGAAYVIVNHGAVSAGCAVIPGLWAVIFSGLATKSKKN